MRVQWMVAGWGWLASSSVAQRHVLPRKDDADDRIRHARKECWIWHLVAVKGAVFKIVGVEAFAECCGCMAREEGGVDPESCQPIGRR